MANKKHGSRKETSTHSTRDSNSNANPCHDCINIHNAREPRGKHNHYFDPRRVKYCPKHQCPVEKTPGVKCHTRKSKLEDQCPEHVVLCLQDGCDIICHRGHRFCPDHICLETGCGEHRNPSGYCRTHTCAKNSCSGLCAPQTSFCQRHACIYRGCQKSAGSTEKYCSDHECSVDQCQFVKEHVKGEGVLREDLYCSNHECGTDYCHDMKVSDNKHCTNHRCTKPGCTESRKSNLPGTFCLQHYNGSIRDKTREEIEAQRVAEARAQSLLGAREAGRREDERRLHEEEEQLQKAMRESKREHYQKEEEEATRVKEELRLKREQDDIHDKEVRRQYEQANIDRAVQEGVQEGIEIEQRRRERELKQAASQTRLNAERDADEARVRCEDEDRRHERERKQAAAQAGLDADADEADRLRREGENQRCERGNERQREKRSQHAGEYKLRPEDATHNRRYPTVETRTRAQRSSYVDPAYKRDGTHREYNDGYASESSVQKRGHSPRVHVYDDDYLRSKAGPSQSRPYGSNITREPTPKIRRYNNYGDEI